MSDDIYIDDDVLDFSGVTGATRVYDYIPYTSHRIKRILKEDFGVYLDPIYEYKANRVPGFVRPYVLKSFDGDVICSRITLNVFRHWFAELGYPEFDEKSTRKNGYNPRAAEFMKIVNKLAARDKGSK